MEKTLRQIDAETAICKTNYRTEQFNKKAQLHSFAPKQWVLLRDFTILGKNVNLAPKWKGPYQIISLKGSCNLLIYLEDRKRMKLLNIENVKLPEKPVYNLQQPENEGNSEKTIQRRGQRGCITFILKSQKKEKILIQLSFLLAVTLLSKREGMEANQILSNSCTPKPS